MIGARQTLIQRELEDGTGASIGVAVEAKGIRSSMRIWFADLDQRHGPVAELSAVGLYSHRVDLHLGNFSGEVLAQIKAADDEDVRLARALVASISPEVKLDYHGQTPEDWIVSSGTFRMSAAVRYETQPDDDASIAKTCRDVIVPMMAAMAELIGYDIIEIEPTDEPPAYEGAVRQHIVNRRERNPRNRLLCIRLNGERCAVCRIEPQSVYGSAGGIIEVHHLEPLAQLKEPRPYDPAKDLVPLCPNCHRAVHTRRPLPLSIDELRSLTEAASE
jgi:5-methylcytosine-specific restriction enzyme A